MGTAVVGLIFALVMVYAGTKAFKDIRKGKCAGCSSCKPSKPKPTQIKF